MLRLPWLALTLLGCLAAGAVRAAEYDLIISGGRVVDGTGAPWFRADVGARSDRIAAIESSRRPRRSGGWTPPESSWTMWPPSRSCCSTRRASATSW